MGECFEQGPAICLPDLNISVFRRRDPRSIGREGEILCKRGVSHSPGCCSCESVPITKTSFIRFRNEVHRGGGELRRSHAPLMPCKCRNQGKVLCSPDSNHFRRSARGEKAPVMREGERFYGFFWFQDTTGVEAVLAIPKVNGANRIGAATARDRDRRAIRRDGGRSKN